MRGSERKRTIGVATGVSALAAAAVLMAGPTGGAIAAPGTTDLRLIKSDSPDPVVEKTDLAYTIQISNLGGPVPGTADATNVTVTDTLPNGITFVSATSASGTCNRAGQTVTCDLGTILEGASATATISVKAGDDGTISNTASVLATEMDPDTANNQDTETTTVSKAPATPKTTKPKKTKKKGKKVQPSCGTPTITGTPGRDVLVGTGGGDVIRGFAGNDVLLGGGGSDILCADFGDDVASGGPGGDILIGSAGGDRLVGGGGPDVLLGKSGRDRLRGQGGRDFMNGGSSTRDKCSGGAGRDVRKACP